MTKTKATQQESKAALEAVSSEEDVMSETEKCPKCWRTTDAERQHGIVRRADESGDGLVHDGGCDDCCACAAAGSSPDEAGSCDIGGCDCGGCAGSTAEEEV